MSIPSHTLEQLNSQADLLGIIGRHTTLKRSGGTYRGKCPFHKGSSNSFSVNPQKNVYHCFKCHASGNAFSFLKDYENLTFIEAAKELSKQTGIDLPKEDKRELHYKRRPLQNTENSRSHQSPTSRACASSSSVKFNNDNTQKFETGIGSPIANNNTSTTPSNFDANTNNTVNVNGDDEAYASYYGNNYYGSNNDSSNNYGNNYEGDSNNDSNYDRSNDMPPPDIYANDVYSDNYLTDYQNYNNNSNQSYGGNTAQYDNQPNASVISSSVVRENASNLESSEGNLYDLLNNINAFYQRNLHNHPPAMAYFKSRGLSDETIETFGLGYAPAGWQHLEQVFARDIDGLRVLGLIRKSEKGREYNLLRDRVIFPIRDNQGRIIGFGGRALDNEVQPKYINSSDSPVFHKQHVLYGYYESRKQRADNWLVVEGYMDVIALYQAGIYGAVASMGTAINEGQIARLFQLNPTLTLSFDGDSAGQKAVWRTLEIALPVLSDDKELRFLTLPGEHDPDTYINENGVAAMREQIAQAMPLSQYIFAYLSERYDLSVAEGKAKLMAQVKQLTNALPKGSSFKYLLNNDIYQKLGGRKRKTITAHDALIDFDSDLTRPRQLALCLLFTPQLLIDDPIGRLWQASGIYNLKTPSGDVTLPSWQDFDSDALLQLSQVIPPIIAYLPDDINAAAHFILANLPEKIQQPLAKRWQPFYRNLCERGISAVDDLFEDLLVQLMLQALAKQQASAKGFVVIAAINQRRQALLNWHKQRLVELANQNPS